ncbi:B9 domain-containing protein 2-like isoform X1 [Sycon ciliatum]|uniref:B9 domain-containing protein 2-like isoform X1 n=1 Tax=Sycon ciliatum TaxID=27933 RepID=UPI0031F6D9E4|eukprot:scpid62210/ scgid13846/ B9 domain-containing protein 2; Stumpy
MAEVHVIGELVGATGFSASGLFCKWTVSHGSSWRLLEGCAEGQTQVDAPQDTSCFYWSHPLDLHFACKAIQGWPKIQVEVWSQGLFGQCELSGYGFCHLPTTPGSHQLQCVTWKPRGTARDQLSSFFLGGAAQLKDEGTVVNAAQRCQLHTVSSGTVQINVSVLLRNFDKFGVEVQ